MVFAQPASVLDLGPIFNLPSSKMGKNRHLSAAENGGVMDVKHRFLAGSCRSEGVKLQRALADAVAPASSAAQTQRRRLKMSYLHPSAGERNELCML